MDESQSPDEETTTDEDARTEAVIPESLEKGERDFYFPATFQFSSKPGRIERILVGTFRERGEMKVRTLTEDDEMPDFYTPAMIHISTKPGRLERFLTALFDEHGKQKFQTVPEEFESDFYMPATTRDATRGKK